MVVPDITDKKQYESLVEDINALKQNKEKFDKSIVWMFNYSDKFNWLLLEIKNDIAIHNNQLSNLNSDELNDHLKQIDDQIKSNVDHLIKLSQRFEDYKLGDNTQDVINLLKSDIDNKIELINKNNAYLNENLTTLDATINKHIHT